ncbi:hypothetical protein B0T26DRAFT_721448 [Lasiosphaeria miniovina]|uniref:Uncharacterized protein n=1 Tax=Lasiosphaeria miniovina TaxID=1954250 RepID=A0AA40A5B5_9PEZI|nr:uncharacterized protein B0T26DRAFT_721448 [Lasiosphaeria miniovina]KAK0709423.1 hypothetical protein B0T26DRAFT_721448 [Lasiosphaeria miniovina]
MVYLGWLDGRPGMSFLFLPLAITKALQKRQITTPAAYNSDYSRRSCCLARAWAKGYSIVCVTNYLLRVSFSFVSSVYIKGEDCLCRGEEWPRGE